MASTMLKAAYPYIDSIPDIVDYINLLFLIKPLILTSTMAMKFHPRPELSLQDYITENKLCKQEIAVGLAQAAGGSRSALQESPLTRYEPGSLRYRVYLFGAEYYAEYGLTLEK